MITYLILFGIITFLLIWFKPYLYEKYYMPEIIFDNNSDKFMFKKRTYPIGWCVYLQYRHRLDDEGITSFEFGKKWLQRKYKDPSDDEEFAEFAIKKFLMEYEPRIYHHIYDKDDSVYKTITYDDLKEKSVKERKELLSDLVETDNDEEFLNRYKTLKDRNKI